MRNIILILFQFFLIAHIAIAQKSYEVKTKIIRLPKYYKAKIPDDAPAVADIKVAPFLWDADRLGYAQVGMTNKKISAIPEESFQEFLQGYITKQYGDDFKSDGIHLLWIIKDLRINERTLFSSEHAFTRLKADGYASADGDTYRFVAAFDTVLRRGGLDVTSRHGQNMAEAFHLFLKQSLERLAAAIAETLATAFTVQQIEEREKDRFAIPILRATKYREGVYASFNEFLQNNPSVTDFEVLAEDKEMKFYSVAGVYKSRLSDPWGLCAEGEIYKYEAGELIPIEKVSNGFIISTYLENVNRRNKNIFIGTMLGGAVGGLAGGVAASAMGASSPGGKIYNVTAIPYITKKQPEACAIDIETGELTF